MSLSFLLLLHHKSAPASVACPALSRTCPVFPQCVASDGKTALVTLPASAHVAPRVATADDAQTPTSPGYIYQEPSCFSFQHPSWRCFSVHLANHCFESTRGEAKTHRYNRVMYA